MCIQTHMGGCVYSCMHLTCIKLWILFSSSLQNESVTGKYGPHYMGKATIRQQQWCHLTEVCSALYLNVHCNKRSPDKLQELILNIQLSGDHKFTCMAKTPVWHVLLILVWWTKQSFWFSTKLKKQHSIKLGMELELNLTPLLCKENTASECKAKNLLTTEASCEHFSECCTSTYAEVLPSVSDLTFDNIWPLLCKKQC